MDVLFSHLLNMSLTGSYVIVLVIVARLLLRKVPKIFSYALWAVVLFRLVCPFSFQSIFSLIPLDNQPVLLETQTSQIPQTQSVVAPVDQTLNHSLTGPVLHVPDAHYSSDPLDVVLDIGKYVWLFGIAVLLMYSIVTTVRLYRNLKPAQPVSRNIYEMQGLATPFVFGIFKPKIYLPAGLGEHERSYILAHEQIHIRRLDHIIKPIAFAVVCVHWFNPLVWIAFYLMSEDMELSCDERVIKQMGSGIKKDYSISLLSLSTGRRFMGCSPLAFGENNTKGRIRNILSYKKPAFWVVIVAMIAVAALSVGLMSNPKPSSLTVEDYAQQFVEQNITSLENNEWSDFKIVDSKITKFEKIAEVGGLLSSPLEIWSLEYRLKPDEISKVTLPVGMNAIDGLITEDGSMGKPLLVFAYEDSAPQYLGVIRSGENDMTSKAGQEMALRVFLEGKGRLSHETYSGNHRIVKFPLSTGETSQLLLSQPVVQGDTGIWCVERWKDTNGNEYYPTPNTDVRIAEYYLNLQNQADSGEHPELLDPLQVAVQYIKDELGQPVSRDELVMDDSATAADFAVTPESNLLGYISNLGMKDDTFDFDNVEWLTLKDSERLKKLKITPAEMPDGYYILNKYTYKDLYKVIDETQYSIVDIENKGDLRTASKQQFIEYLEQYSGDGPLCIISIRNGVVTGIAQKLT
ncbi:hypothetical protein J7E73_26345 [Paenibacillus albidus]|uniref:M56 family metallopeptidase n=1 Tax=Paenibacillus albidus TaxID=2041023 RepID=UPI001BE9ED1B|nr:M56 family metallopeptidase [Paenibacillus albidus]MBT2292592.1 hypothetical protein [Paenibacillus albidus]